MGSKKLPDMVGGCALRRVPSPVDYDAFEVLRRGGYIGMVVGYKRKKWATTWNAVPTIKDFPFLLTSLDAAVAKLTTAADKLGW